MSRIVREATMNIDLDLMESVAKNLGYGVERTLDNTLRVYGQDLYRTVEIIDKGVDTEILYDNTDANALRKLIPAYQEEMVNQKLPNLGWMKAGRVETQNEVVLRYWR